MDIDIDIDIDLDNKNITCLVSHFKGNFKNIIYYLNEKVYSYNKINNYDLNIIIYNKNNNIDIDNKFFKNKNSIINVPNIGVDAYDKLHYIINNYDLLPNIILFSTDSMFSEPKKQKKIKFILDNLHLLYQNSGFLTGHIYNIHPDECKFSLDYYIHNNIKRKLYKSSIRPFDKWFSHFILGKDSNINIKCDISNIYICKKSTFAVTKDLILSNSKDFYVKLLGEVCKNSKMGHDSEVPHYLERAWVEIFCKNDVNKMFHDFNTYGKI
jgi:hypothetical protein